MTDTAIDLYHPFIFARRKKDRLFRGVVAEFELFKEEWPGDGAKSFIQLIYIRQNGTEISFATI